MKSEPYIQIEIDKEGNITVNAENYVGKYCEEAWDQLIEELKKLGVKPKTKVKRKREYYVTVTSKTKTKIRI